MATIPPVMLYMEDTPNPESRKFVLDRMIFEKDYYEFQTEEDAAEAPLIKKLFGLEGVQTAFVSNNFITITKDNSLMWIEISPIIKETIVDHIEAGLPVFSPNFKKTNRAEVSNEPSSGDDDIDAKIKTTLDKYVTPAVEMDGGAISFVSFVDGKLTLSLQGACSGCPSSTVTLKQGIENLMQRMIPEVKEVVAEEG